MVCGTTTIHNEFDVSNVVCLLTDYEQGILKMHDKVLGGATVLELFYFWHFYLLLYLNFILADLDFGFCIWLFQF